MQTYPFSYMNDTYSFAALCNVLEIGSDEKGGFLTLDRSIFYPGGGGQPKDRGEIQFNNVGLTITDVDFSGDAMKHYISGNFARLKKEEKVAIVICRHTRILHSAYHTAGHWIASIATENLGLSLTPIKGYHYPDGAYVEFDGDKSEIAENILERIHFAMAIDRQAHLKIAAEIISADDTTKLNQAMLPENFRPNPNKPLRLVTIEGYKSVPCGGTHLSGIREIKSLQATKIFWKNGKIRISYHCTPWEMPVS